MAIIFKVPPLKRSGGSINIHGHVQIRPQADPQFFHHCPYRPWQIDARRPPAGTDPHGRSPRNAGASSRQHGPRTGAGHHHQSPPRHHALQGKRWRIYQINFIDTPGHVDFAYEVSRSLSACEGALLVVDAVQGVQAQSLANVHLAIDRNLEIVPVINKIDLPAADPEGVKQQIEDVIGIDASNSLLISAKTGLRRQRGPREDLDRYPRSAKHPPMTLLRALVFDSHYDPYRGVMVYVRVMSGEITKKSLIRLMANQKNFRSARSRHLRPE